MFFISVKRNTSDVFKYVYPHIRNTIVDFWVIMAYNSYSQSGENKMITAAEAKELSGKSIDKKVEALCESIH